MRIFLLALTCLAISCREAPVGSGPTAGGTWAGPDAVLVRVPADGGVVRAYRWGRDSVIWASTQAAPPVRELLAFDADQGSLVFVDRRGVPGRIELRLGTVAPAATTPMTSLVSADGWAIFGLNPRGDLQRLTPSGTWSHTSALTPRLILPQPDGSLVLVNDIGGRSALRRMHPPEARIIDTASVPQAAFAIPTPLGDRVYFATDSGLAGVRVRDLARTRNVALPGPAVDAVPTPSGDRVYVAIANDRSIVVIDRYEERVDRTIQLPAIPVALRMDPDGRYLLARYDAVDSVAVISVAEARVVRVLASPWRRDLPLVAPDGAVLVPDSTDAVVVEPPTGAVRRRFAGGAADVWALIRWNGFRPRAKGLDQPVSFDADSTDSLGVAVGDSVTPRPPATAAAPPGAAPPPSREESPPETRPRPAGWTLSFAALLDEQRARALAGTIRVEGHTVHVVSNVRDGVTIWRVVAGPFAGREEAERAGRRTGLPFWVYEESP